MSIIGLTARLVIAYPRASAVGAAGLVAIGAIDNGGSVSIELESTVVDNQNNSTWAKSRARANIYIQRSVNDKNFAFLSAGFKHGDNSPINLANLYISGDRKGTILLRENSSLIGSCYDFKKLMKYDLNYKKTCLIFTTT